MQLNLQLLNRNSQIALWLILGSLAVSLSVAVLFQQFQWLLIAPALLVVIGCLLYTEQALLLSGAFAPLSINQDNLMGGFGMSLPTEPVYIFLFGLLIFQWFKEGMPIDLKVLKHPIVLFVTAYGLWLWISSVFSTMPLVSFKFTLARTWYIVLFFYFGMRIFKNYQRIHFYFGWFTAFIMGVVFYTLIEHSKDGFSRGSSYGISWPFFPDHGMYAAGIAWGVFVLVVYAFYVRQFGFNVAFGPVFLLLLLILLFAVVVSFTRATWLSLIVAAGVWFITKLRIQFYWVLIAVFSILTVGIIKQDEIMYSLEANKQGSSDELEGHVKSVSNITTDPSNLERINRWKCAGRMVAQRPIFGFGPGTYVFQYAPFQKSSELTLISTHAGDLGDAHSEYFSSMSETGFPGMFFWLGIVFSTVWISFRLIYTSKNFKHRLTTYIALTGLVAYYAHAVLNNYTQYDKLAVPFWAFTAVIVALDLKSKKQTI